MHQWSTRGRACAVVSVMVLAGCAASPPAGDGLVPASSLVSQARDQITEIDLAALRSMQAANSELVLVDVREPYEFEQGHIPGAVNIPRGRLEFDILDHPVMARLNEAAGAQLADTSIVLYCRSGGRAALAAQTLQAMGFRAVVSVAGGYKAWEAAETGDSPAD